MKNTFFIFTLFFSIITSSQVIIGTEKADNIMAKIPVDSTTTTTGISNYIKTNFKTENDKIRAVFYWIASNISYDVQHMFEPNTIQNPKEKIASTLKTKTGVCIHYAEVFNAIANKLGIKTRIIVGYTKQNGVIATISHAWCASQIDGKWFLFDPTWGSGGLNNGKFVKKLNNSYYKVEPQKMIVSHIPFDYLWQFLNFPITNKEFYEGKTASNTSKKSFDFQNEINKFEKLIDTDKAFESAARIEANGIVNNLILDQYKFEKNNFKALNQNKNIDKVKLIVTNYNEAITYLNDFIVYRNKKFKPEQSDSELKMMIQNVKDKFKKCENDIYSLGSLGNENASNLNSIKKSIASSIAQTEAQEVFVKEYLSKSEIGRKLMFSSFRKQN
ncbi:transglutaminase domain-containing protein [Flavobacterium sp.]|uniref:transglutaminase domain-containing protein n=1 Tax=Flavobacterium sp. TaxID=239 RepID=UPI00286D2A90|nr:transglutaminase domain-containing protein [Flavobacterium sp.]